MWQIDVEFWEKCQKVTIIQTIPKWLRITIFPLASSHSHRQDLWNTLLQSSNPENKSTGGNLPINFVKKKRKNAIF